MAAVTAQTSLPTAAELVRSRYTPSSPYFTRSTEPQVQQLFDNELRQAPVKKTAYHEQAALWAQYPCTIQHPNSRFSPQPAMQKELSNPLKLFNSPAHKALAARLAATTVRQQRQQQQRRNDNVWSTRLAADVAAVCSELGLPAAAARSLAAAAMKGKISANPGVLLSLLCRIMPLEQHLGGPSNLAHLITALPTVILQDPKTLISNLSAAQQLMGAAAAAAILKQYPQLVTCSPFRLQTNVNRFQDLLQFPSMAAAAAACARQPLLLLMSADSLQQRWQQLQRFMAAVGVEELNGQLRKTPELLLLKTSTVAMKMQCLDQMFRGYQHVPPPPAAAAGARGRRAAAAAAAAVDDNAETGFLLWNLQEQLPQLDTKQQQQVAQKLEEIKAATAALQQRQQQPKYKQHQQQLRQPQLHSIKSSSISSSISSSSSSSSSICDPRVQQLVLKLPALLSLNPDTLHQHVLELQLLLGLQPDDGQLQRIVLLQPGLLTQSPATLGNKLQLLQFLTNRSECMVQEMVLKCPAILTLSVSNVTSKWDELQKCVSVCGDWQQQLKDAANVTLAVTLCYSVKRLQRLRYVAEIHCMGNVSSSSSSQCGGLGTTAAAAATQQRPQQQQQQQGLASVPWRSLIQQSDAAFCKRYPGFAAWQQQQQQ